MAYPARGRDPLLDTATQAFLERRAREILGAAMILIALILAITLLSYSAKDQGLLATGGVVGNWMGRFGAVLADPLVKIVGYGAWAVPVLLLGWGLRFVTHHGTDRLFQCGIYAPFILVLAPIYAATLPPPLDWVHNFSMGGKFGDTVLILLLQIFPGSAALGANVFALVIGLILLALTVFVL
ncbi:MAG: DNA translocase FtsK 4TM domain-containing protein, partial [Pseudomonadota bacterium]